MHGSSAKPPDDYTNISASLCNTHSYQILPPIITTSTPAANKYSSLRFVSLEAQAQKSRGALPGSAVELGAMDIQVSLVTILSLSSIQSNQFFLIISLVWLDSSQIFLLESSDETQAFTTSVLFSLLIH